MKVAIFGASGFVGSTLTERLLQEPDCEVKPLIHSSGSAWRLARLGIDLHATNLLSRESVRDALADCTHVVNCSRGNDQLMVTGLRNLLRGCAAANVKRLVHLSSVAVYGDPPPTESVREDAPTKPERGSYGSIKLRQDRMVEAAHRRGLSSVVLCPPNIGGPYSYFLLGLRNAIATGQFALLETGDAPCSLVDVDNLAYAIVLALRTPNSDGRRIFVTDTETASWGQLVDALNTDDVPTPSPISTEEARNAWQQQRARRPSLFRSLVHLVSSDVREALRKDPFIAKADRGVRGLVSLLPDRLEDKLRLSVEGPSRVAKFRTGPNYDARLCSQQFRGVAHSCERARAEIGYEPPHSTTQSIAAFNRWYRGLAGTEDSGLALLREL